MKYFLHCLAGTMLVLCVFFFNISCPGKKGVAGEDRAQENEPAVVEQAAREPEVPDWFYDWLLEYDPSLLSPPPPPQPKLDEEAIKTIKSHFVGDPQLDEETRRSVESYIEGRLMRYGSLIDSDDLILDGVQHIKLPNVVWHMEMPIDPDWDAFKPLVFVASYMTSQGISEGRKAAAVYLHIFYKKDGLIDFLYSILLENTLDEIINITNGSELNYDYIEDLPGRRIGNSSAFVVDYNQDGYDEIAMFLFDPKNLFTSIYRYSMFGCTHGTKEEVNFEPIFEARLFLRLRWDVKTWEYGPPVQFFTYKGTEGFVIYEDVPTGKRIIATYDLYGNPLDEVDEYIQQWNFYAWDMEEGKYVLIDKMDPEDIKTQWQSAKK
jgi:hypothetical protein